MEQIPDPGYYTMSEAKRLAPEPLHVEIGGTAMVLILFGILLLLQHKASPAPEIALSCMFFGGLGILLAMFRHLRHDTPLYRMRHSNIGKELLRCGETLRGIRDHSGIKLPTEEERISEQQHLLLNYFRQEELTNNAL